MEKLRVENEYLKSQLENMNHPHSKGINTKESKLSHEVFSLKMELTAI